MSDGGEDCDTHDHGYLVNAKPDTSDESDLVSESFTVSLAALSCS